MATLPLGLVSVATAVRLAGNDIKILDVPADKDHRSVITTAVDSFQPDCIGLSIRNIDDQTMEPTRFLLPPLRAIVTACRAATDAPVIIGGAGYSIFPESCLSYLGADMGIRGEGEQVLPAVLRHIRNGTAVSGIPGVYLPGRVPRQQLSIAADMEVLPYAAPDLWPCPESDRRRVWLPFQTRRGCPMNCSYCSTADIEGTRLRQRSPDTVIDSLKRAAAAGYRQFFCTDNTFNIPSSYAAALCRKLASAGLDLSWMCIIYPCAIDEALVRDMAQSGCSEISLGFESGCRRILQNMNKRYTPDDVRSCAELFARHGIRQTGYLLLGGPGEDRASVLESLAFADSLPLDSLKITSGIRLYPHTLLAAAAVREGKIDPHDDLLYPRFYMTEGLGSWLKETTREWAARRPHWQL